MADLSNSTVTSTSNPETYALLGALEGSLAILSGIVDAIDEISSRSRGDRRLGAICALCSPIRDQLEDAQQANRGLYEVYFAAKSTGNAA